MRLNSEIDENKDTVSTKLQVENVIFSRNKKQIKNIYVDAFPKRERMPFGFMLALSCLPTTRFYAFYDCEVLCGLIYMGIIGRQAFIMFFAVDEKLRSKGYGSRILAAIREKYSKCSVVVSIEPCDEKAEDFELRKRRKNFYLRNGYSDTMYNLKLNGTVQEVLISNGKFNKVAFSAFLLLYSCFAIIPRIFIRK